MLGIVFLLQVCIKPEPIQQLFMSLSPAVTNITFENNVDEEGLFNSINYLYFYSTKYDLNQILVRLTYLLQTLFRL